MTRKTRFAAAAVVAIFVLVGLWIVTRADNDDRDLVEELQETQHLSRQEAECVAVALRSRDIDTVVTPDLDDAEAADLAESIAACLPVESSPGIESGTSTTNG